MMRISHNLTFINRQGWFTSWLLQGTNLWHQWPFGVLRGTTTCTSWYLSWRDDHSRIIWKVNNAILNSINLTYHVNSVKSVCTMYSSYFLHTQQSICDRVLWSEIESGFLDYNLGQTWTNPWTRPKNVQMCCHIAQKWPLAIKCCIWLMIQNSFSEQQSQFTERCEKRCKYHFKRRINI